MNEQRRRPRSLRKVSGATNAGHEAKYDESHSGINARLETNGHETKRSERKKHEEKVDENLETKPREDAEGRSVYETAKSERINASCCPKDYQPKSVTSLPLRRRKIRRTLVFATSTEESEDEGFRSGATMRRRRTRKRQSKESSRRRKESRSPSSSSRERSTKMKYKIVPATPWQTPKSSHQARTKNRTPKRDSSSDESSSSEQGENESMVRMPRPKHMLKPPKSDGVMSFETFWAQFKNCAEHNGWNRRQKQGENESMVRMPRPKHMLKPPKFDGVMSFETFWAQFKNCAEHNGWNRRQKLVYLRSSLDKESATRMTNQSGFAESLRVCSKQVNASFASVRSVARSQRDEVY